jgi:uncharacterized protein YceK
MKIILIMLIVFLSGCATATYHFKRCSFATADDGEVLVTNSGEPFQVCTEASISSDREMKDGILVEYNAENNSIKIQAGSVTTGENAANEFGFKMADKLLETLGDKND